MGRMVSGRRLFSWAGALVLLGTLAAPVSAAPPPWAPPGAGSGSGPATQIAICCTWGTGIVNGITYSIDAPDVATADAIAAGVEAWESEVGGGVHFDPVVSGAEVTIRFKRGGGTTAGSTSRSSSGGFIFGGSVSISGKAFGSANTAAQITTVVAHEWGHVLGLNHANGTGQLMSPTLDPSITAIQQCDALAAQTALGWFVPVNTGTPTAPPSTRAC